MNQRMCAACKKRADKKDFIRVEKVDDNVVISNKKSDGTRGIYFCFDKNCVEKAKKSNVIKRTFNISVDENFYDELKNLIERKTNVK